MKKLKSLFKNKKVLLGVVGLLVVVGAVYKVVLAPKPAVAAKKVEGSLVALSEPFTLNLAGGHYGRLSVSLLIDEPAVPLAEGAVAPPLPQNDLIRSIITDNLTGIDSSRLIDRNERHELLAQLVADLKKSTDEPVKEVLITDLAVQ